MKLKVVIEMDNEAFEGSNVELARILRKLADHAEDQEAFTQPYLFCPLRDINGNKVGVAEVIR